MQRQIVLDAVLQEGDDAGADNGADELGRPADHGHHEIVDADMDIERRRAHEAARDAHTASRRAPANNAAIMKVTSRVRNASMPRLSTKPLPPRSARIARPSRDCSRLRDSSRAAISTAQIR